MVVNYQRWEALRCLLNQPDEAVMPLRAHSQTRPGVRDRGVILARLHKAYTQYQLLTERGDLCAHGHD